MLSAVGLSQWNHRAYLEVDERNFALTQSGDFVSSVPGALVWDELMSGDAHGRLLAMSGNAQVVIAVGEAGVILRLDVAEYSLFWVDSPRILEDLYSDSACSRSISNLEFPKDGNSSKFYRVVYYGLLNQGLYKIIIY